jgi:hypothetical protein
MKLYMFKYLPLSHTEHYLYLFSVSTSCSLSETFSVRFKGEIVEGLIYRLEREGYVIQQ